MINLRKVAFIGGGNMAAALIGGLMKVGLAAERVVVADPSGEQLDRMAEKYAVTTSPDNESAVLDADVVILAVKPQQLKAICLALAPHLRASRPLVISVAAGITHAALTDWLGEALTIVRTMPNRPALDGHGASGLYAPTSVNAADRSSAEAIMSAVGVAVWVDHESQMDVVTALSGSGPAYFFLLMEALQSAAEAQGLPADLARKLTLATAVGASSMASNSADTLAELRAQVTSKGGTTAAALDVLNTEGFASILARAVDAATRRSAELAIEFGT